MNIQTYGFLFSPSIIKMNKIAIPSLFHTEQDI